MIPSVFAGVDLRDLEKIKALTRNAYPLVPQLDTGTLAKWMQADGPALLLVDVRAPAEFAVSHLRGALNLQSAKQITEVMAAQKPAKLVLYCAVGFRSSRLANILGQNGACEIMNLEGSIFQWVNEGRVVCRGTETVQQVHPCGKRWAGLLKAGLASDV
jgi:rhodanese-related sulfurtransferase